MSDLLLTNFVGITAAHTFISMYSHCDCVVCCAAATTVLVRWKRIWIKNERENPAEFSASRMNGGGDSVSQTSWLYSTRWLYGDTNLTSRKFLLCTFPAFSGGFPLKIYDTKEALRSAIYAAYFFRILRVGFMEFSSEFDWKFFGYREQNKLRSCSVRMSLNTIAHRQLIHCIMSNGTLIVM